MISRVVVDTDVFSFSFKGDSRAKIFERITKESDPCLSFMTVAELLRWSLAHRWGPARRASLEAAIAQCMVLPYDLQTARVWAEVTSGRDRIGRTISCGDCWIAACAIRHDLPLLTHNPSDFEVIPSLQVLYPT